jgi:hypothetical protein
MVYGAEQSFSKSLTRPSCLKPPFLFLNCGYRQISEKHKFALANHAELVVEGCWGTRGLGEAQGRERGRAGSGEAGEEQGQRLVDGIGRLEHDEVAYTRDDFEFGLVDVPTHQVHPGSDFTGLQGHPDVVADESSAPVGGQGLQ